MNSESVVISGISGRFPDCDSYEQFGQALFKQADLVKPHVNRFGPKTDTLFKELSTKNGQVPDWHKFDARFFGLPDQLADRIDPQARKLCEVTYEAIADAGLSVDQLRQCRTAIFGGFSHNEIDRQLTVAELNATGNADAGAQQRMFNLFHRQLGCRWLAYLFDIQGPLHDYESACSSAVTGLVDAYHAIASGRLDVALICSANLNLSPHLQLQYVRLNLISADGACQFLDAQANGYVKSEAAICIVLQKLNHRLCRQARALIRAAEYNTDGYKPEGITYPSWTAQAQLMQRCYQRSGVDPHQINYVEAHGTGTQAGDVQEMRAIDQVFNSSTCYNDGCTGRQQVLRVGSVKSNCGHTEATSGLISIAKVLIAFQHDLIPASIHFRTPNPSIDSLIQKRIKPVVGQSMPLNTQCVGLSSFGFGGSNVHLILEHPSRITCVQSVGQHLQSKYQVNESDFKLILLSSRTKLGLERIANRLLNHCWRQMFNPVEIKLLNQFATNQSKCGFTQTGYMIVHPEQEQCQTHFSDQPVEMSAKQVHLPIASTDQSDHRLVVFVVPGLGCQWSGMGASLANIPFFHQQLKHYCSLIQPQLSFNILDCLLNNTCHDTFDLSSSIYCLIGLAIFQMSYIDLLAQLGIRPDIFVGHSFGELICAWIDQLISADQVLQATLALTELVCPALARFDCNSNEPQLNLTKGSMAVLNCGHEQAQQLLSRFGIDRVQVACDNSDNCVTISGHADQVDMFLQQLMQSQTQVSGKLINSCQMAFHSELVREYYPILKDRLESVMGSVCHRSSAWISTSLSLTQGHENVNCVQKPKSFVKHSTSIGNYFVNCILTSVNFRQACLKISDDLQMSAQHSNHIKPIVIEIAPRKYIGPLAKTSLDAHLMPALQSPSNLAQLNSNQIRAFNYTYLLQLLGHVHEFGLTLDTRLLEFPVDDRLSNTCHRFDLGSLIQWNHDHDHLVRTYPKYFNPCPAGQQYLIGEISNPFLNIQSTDQSVQLLISSVVQIILNEFTSINNLTCLTCVAIENFKWFKNQTFHIKSKISVDFLPLDPTNDADQMNKFEVHCDKQLIACGNIKLINNFDTNWTQVANGNHFMIDTFYEQLLANNNYVNLSPKPLQSIQIYENVLIGKVINVDLAWSAMMESLIQLALSTTNVDWKQVESVCIQEINFRFSVNNDLIVNYEMDCKTGYSNLIQLKQINFLKYQKENTLISSTQDVLLCSLSKWNHISKQIVSKHANSPLISTCLIITDNFAFAFTLIHNLIQFKPEVKVSVVWCAEHTTDSDFNLIKFAQNYSKWSENNVTIMDSSAWNSLACKSFDVVCYDWQQIDHIDQSIDVVSDHGQWICLDGKALALNRPLGLGHLLRNITLIGIDTQTAGSDQSFNPPPEMMDLLSS